MSDARNAQKVNSPASGWLRCWLMLRGETGEAGGGGAEEGREVARGTKERN